MVATSISPTVWRRWLALGLRRLREPGIFLSRLHAGAVGREPGSASSNVADDSSSENESHPLIRILAPFGAPVGGGVAWAVGRPVWQAVLLTVVYLVAYAIWQFIDVWLVPVLRADSTKRTRRMLGDDVDAKPS